MGGWRAASSSSTKSESVVNLAYDKLVPPNGNENDQPLVILHGLFGTKRNWQSLSKAFMRDLERPVKDLRNHGSSPHAEPMTYSAMMADVLHFCTKHSLSRISLLGHSMGGKVAMAFALSPDTPSDLLSHLIVADISPAIGPLSPEFQGYIEAMKKIEESKVTTRKEAQDIMTAYEKDPMTRAFLLTNLAPTAANEPVKFRLPLDIIGNAILELGSFPFTPGERQWDGKTLFIKGAKSKYINKHNLPIAKQFFPNMVAETLDAGHWVHAERPNEFKKLVTDFIQSH